MLITTNIYASNLPDLGSSDQKDYDIQTETNLGRAFSTAIYQHYDLVKDTIVLSYIRRIGKKVVAQTGEKRHFSFHVINNDQINAFAGPNGVIGIHTGLITSAKSEDELASVIAHEVAHVTLRHLSRTYEYHSNIGVSNIATIIAAILIGSQNPGAGIATYIGAMGLTIQNQLKNSRIHEAEADYTGIKYLHKSGYNAHAMANFFSRLHQESQLYEHKVPEILLTHPITQSRLAKSEARAFQLDNKNTSFKKATLRLIQLRLASLNNETKNSYKKLQLSNDEKCYFDNLTKKGNLKCLKIAIKNHPEERLYKIQQAKILADYSPSKGYRKFRYLAELFPSDFSIIYSFAEALEKNGHTKQAIKILKTATPKFFYQHLLYSKLSLLYANEKQTSKSYYYEALSSLNIGNVKKSIHLIKQAQKITPKKNPSFLKKLNLLSKQLESIKKLNKTKG